MKILLSVLIPILILAYYLRSDWQIIKSNRILMGVLMGGTFIYYFGLAFSVIDPAVESLLKLVGACLFFTGVAFHTAKRPPNNPDETVKKAP